MLENLYENQELTYRKLSPEELSKRGILGRLVGVIADFKNPTRNGRKYTEELWEKVFNNPIMLEKLNNRCLFGELGHPADRTEVDMEKIAICLSEKPKKAKDGTLKGVFDILDTPCGRILKTMCDYGCKIGVSSRGQGDLVTDYDGNESVNPDTYDCECWDAVLIPAVESARMSYVTESLDKKRSNKTLKESLESAIANETADNQRAMKESLENLGIDLEEQAIPRDRAIDKCMSLGKLFVNHFDKIYNDTDAQSINHWANEMQTWLDTVNSIVLKENNKQLGIDKKVDYFFTVGSEPEVLFKSNPTEADVYSDFIDLVLITGSVEKSLKKLNLIENEYINDITDESLNINEVAETTAVVNDLAIVEELQKTVEAKTELETKLINLQEKLSVCYAKEVKQEEQINRYKKAINILTEKSKKIMPLENQVSNLNEQLDKANSIIKESVEKVKVLESQIRTSNSSKMSLQELIHNKELEFKTINESIDELKIKFNSEKKSLTENIETLKKDLQQKTSDYSKKLENSNLLVEKYKKIANSAVDKYISSQALRLGVSADEIRNKLPKSYTFEDINSICEDLQSYRVNISKLPISINENTKVKFTSPQKPLNIPANDRDDVDDDLLSLAGLK